MGRLVIKGKIGQRRVKIGQNPGMVSSDLSNMGPLGEEEKGGRRNA